MIGCIEEWHDILIIIAILTCQPEDSSWINVSHDVSGFSETFKIFLCYRIMIASYKKITKPCITQQMSWKWKINFCCDRPETWEGSESESKKGMEKEERTRRKSLSREPEGAGEGRHTPHPASFSHVCSWSQQEGKNNIFHPVIYEECLSIL